MGIEIERYPFIKRKWTAIKIADIRVIQDITTSKLIIVCTGGESIIGEVLISDDGKRDIKLSVIPKILLGLTILLFLMGIRLLVK